MIFEKLNLEIIKFQRIVPVEFIEIFMSQYCHKLLCQELTKFTGIKIEKLEKYFVIPIVVYKKKFKPEAFLLIDSRKYKLNPFYEQNDLTNSKIWYQEHFNIPIERPPKII
jgi:hypothetical protein